MEASEIFQRIEAHGIDFERFQKTLDQRDNWGDLVHAFEYLTVLSVVEWAWKKAIEEGEVWAATESWKCGWK